MPRCLVVTDDPVGERMGGKALRATALAGVLGHHGPTALAAPGGEMDWSLRDVRALRAAVRGADVVVATPMGPVAHAALRGARRLIFDLYDPAPLEVAQAYAGASPLRRRLATTLARDAFTAALRDGQHFLCATDRQVDLYLGVLLGLGLLGEDARERFAVVPFGLPAALPVAGAPGPRERFPAIGDGPVVLWNGGIWNWLDPVGAVRAVAAVPAARLVFMGRPPLVAGEDAAALAARREARERGLLDQRVFFNDDWVPHEQRAAWLLQSSCVLSAHRDHLETRYAFRTRLLDALWTATPIVCTGGDELAELVARDDLGAVAAPGDHAALAGGLRRVLDGGRERYAPRLAAAAERFRWDSVAEPLVRLIVEGRPAAPLGRRLTAPAQRVRGVLTRVARRR